MAKKAIGKNALVVSYSEVLNKNANLLNSLYDYIQENLQPGIDYGQADSRSNKPSLLKPGAEKVMKWMGCRFNMIVDEDAMKWMGDGGKHIIYKCVVIGPDEEVWGEGSGGGTVGDQGRDVNKTVKVARKRAYVDAVLITFGLSERFTQDGGGGQRALTEAKESLKEYVTDVRQSIQSDVSTNNWIKRAIFTKFKRTDLPTPGAVQQLRRAVENSEFNLDTGDLILVQE